jgi:4-diphosphocytidyl-2-C-methyl-D-erythritol kinase
MKNTIIARAHGKINWIIDIAGRAENGYHALDMLVQSVSLSNQLIFTPADEVRLWADGILINNPSFLVLRAAHMLRQATGYKGGAEIIIQKNIPDRAGLGGGSADCAAALISLNALWGLGLSADDLLALGARLGSDVPFCLVGGLMRVGGFGETLTPVKSTLSPHILIIMPDEGLPTEAVYRRYDICGGDAPASVDGAIGALLAGDYAALSELSGNALRRAAQQLSPAIVQAVNALKRHGALYAQMTGSGSAVYGVFEDAAVCRRVGVALSRSFNRCYVTRVCDSGVEI